MCVCVYENIYGCMGGWAIVPTCKPMGVLRLCMRGACMPVHVRGGGCVNVHASIHGRTGDWATVPLCKPMGVLRLCMGVHVCRGW